MAAPLLSEQDLIDYCLRALGAPVIQINVDQEQLSDRISDALSMFAQFHAEATQRTYISHKITGSTIQLTSNVAANFTAKETISCNTSGATFVLYDDPEINKLRTRKITGTPIPGETIAGNTSNSTATIAANGIVIGNIQNQYITLPDEIVSVIRTLPWNVANRGGDNYIFDATYQIMLSDIMNYRNADMTYYVMIQQNLAMLDYTLNTKQSISFSQITGKLKLAANAWDSILIDQYVVMEAYTSIVNGQNSKVYDDFWVKKYSTALIKRQFAINLSKFSNVILPGGITLNAERMMTEANTDITELEAMLKTSYAAPLQFFVG